VLSVRIGVVSDTHNHLANVRRIVEILNAAGVERVVHTGDITQAKTLDALAGLAAPLYGVYGNNDLEREALDESAGRHRFQLVDPPLELRWAERRILVVHDPRDAEPALREEHVLVLHGHTHRTRAERRRGRLFFNPGECAGHLRGRNRVGVVDLASLATELLHF
jgi:putative phosphoesterase